jgi:TolB-like protein
MKRSAVVATLFLFAALSFASLQLSAQPYDRLVEELLAEVEEDDITVAVTPFEPPQGTGGDLGRTVAQEVVAALTDQGAVVVERENLEEVMEEIQLQMSGMVAPEDAAEVGRAVGAGYIVSGTISEFREPSVENPGLRVRARIVAVETAEVLASASTEVERSDPRTAYAPRGLQAAEYPQFLSLLAGAAFQDGQYPDIDEDAAAYEEYFGAGFTAAIRHVPAGSGFFTNARELTYEVNRRGDAEGDSQVHTFRYAPQFLVRLPMWRYVGSFARLTNLYFGVGAGAGLTYHVPKDGDNDPFFGLQLQGQAFAGFALALSPNWALDVQYRFFPQLLGYGWYGIGSGDVVNGVDPVRMRTHSVVAGFSLVP